MRALRAIAAALTAVFLLAGCAVDVDDDSATVKPAKVKVEVPD